jgi:hypothetical protein
LGAAGKRRKVFPYYKVQKRTPRVLAWSDARKKAFDTLEEAQAFITSQAKPDECRVLVVERNRRYVLNET